MRADGGESAKRPRITKRYADGLRFADVAPAGAGRVIVWDGDLPGFGLRLMESGTKFYVVAYRNAHNRQRRMTIGRHGKITAEEARGIALDVFSAVRAGKDPLNERQATRKAPTMNDLLDRYVAKHVEKKNRPSTQEQVKRLVEQIIRPKLGAQKVAAITLEDMQDLHQALSVTPRQANLVIAICSKAFTLAEKWRWRSDNPCRHVERNEEIERKAFLKVDELGRLGATLRLAETDGLPWHIDPATPASKHLAKPDRRRTRYSRVTTAAIELLLFTGCRLSEVLNLKWVEVDNPETGIITLPVTKSGEEQYVLITAQARLVLDELKRIRGTGPWVLPSTVDPKVALTKSALEQAWQRIRIAADIPTTRLHDLRHTYGTYAGQSGGNAFMIRDLLRHRDLATSALYVSREDAALRAVSERVTDRIAAGLAGKGKVEGGQVGNLPPDKPSAEVIALKHED